MPDLTVPAVLFSLVLLILLGQWVVLRRAKSARGQWVPHALWEAIHPSQAAQTDAELPELEGMNVLVSFEAPNCSACRRMAPALDSLSTQYPGRIAHLSVLSHRALAQSLRIMGTPTLVLIQNGQIVDVFVGITSLTRLTERLQHYWPDVAPQHASPPTTS
ncbi:MAG: thioredoxin family protein [Halothiobacillus sp.]